ncbi:MAG: 50S ribosomal protein L18 [Lachnospiraceae bacterium]|jgi:large subunit ribosomal protein L18|nr:50S ribosomal protein L18 [Lachnospiraceae bacterium]
MINKKSRSLIREKKHRRLRNHLVGTPDRPRLCVFRSNKNIYAQIIDDEAANTLVAASTLEKDIKADLNNTDDTDAAKALGTAIAKKAIEKGIKTVVFDRSGYIYKGKVAAVAEAAREAGLEF